MAKFKTSYPLSDLIKKGVRKAVALPTLKIPFDQPLYVRFDGEYIVKMSTEKGDDGQLREKQICVAKVTHVDADKATEDEREMVVPAVLKAELDEIDYVGRLFEITKSKKEGKRYNTFTLFEIQIADDDDNE